MPISLHFVGLIAAEATALGPALNYRISGNQMRADDGDRVVAELVRHQWKVGGRYFSRYECLGPAVYSFAGTPDVDSPAHASVALADSGRQSPKFGTFDNIRAADGMLYAGGKLVARFIEQKSRWLACELGISWPQLILEAADGEPLSGH